MVINNALANNNDKNINMGFDDDILPNKLDIKNNVAGNVCTSNNFLSCK